MENQLMFSYPKQKPSFVQDIVKVVSTETEISEDLMFTPSRKREIVEARQLAMALSKVFVKTSLATIGEKIGGKDHATVLHACKTISNLCDTDLLFRGRYNNLYVKVANIIEERNIEILVCAECGSSDIFVKEWINVNTKNQLSSTVPLSNVWCKNCSKTVDYCTSSYYSEKIEKRKNERNKMETIPDSM